MHLKSYLKKTMDEKLVKLESEAVMTKKALKDLQKTNLRKAYYIVRLNSLWANEGEKSIITTTYGGSLEKTIKDAEQEFKKINNRSDVQAVCSVQIRIGSSVYVVPQKFWDSYKEKH